MEITYSDLITSETTVIVTINGDFEAYVRAYGDAYVVDVYDARSDRLENWSMFHAPAPSLGDGVQIATQFVAAQPCEHRDVSRAVAGRGPWECMNCGGTVTDAASCSTGPCCGAR